MLVAAPASGQGKTMATAALARLHRQRGRRVRVFKTGPDFLDPMILERACGAPVYQLDLWMVGEAECRRRLFDAAGEADLILVEGVMGLYDGEPSSADLAIAFGLPVLLVVDASAMAQTFGAVCHGLATYRPGVRVAGSSRTGWPGPGHARLLQDSLPPGMPFYGAVATGRTGAARPAPRALSGPGDRRPGRPARRGGASRGGDRGGGAAGTPWLSPSRRIRTTELLLEGVRIGVARDAAFSFILSRQPGPAAPAGRGAPLLLAPGETNGLPEWTASGCRVATRNCTWNGSPKTKP
ncbi:MAG: hypothetical protein KatS3mg123_0742 [Burkholderiales bacterium]|nr:MAG: hypothetical protein KatS3mg123_0742 [Burkholderiales bacterium]